MTVEAVDMAEQAAAVVSNIAPVNPLHMCATHAERRMTDGVVDMAEQAAAGVANIAQGVANLAGGVANTLMPAPIIARMQSAFLRGSMHLGGSLHGLVGYVLYALFVWAYLYDWVVFRN